MPSPDHAMLWGSNTRSVSQIRSAQVPVTDGETVSSTKESAKNQLLRARFAYPGIRSSRNCVTFVPRTRLGGVPDSLANANYWSGGHSAQRASR